MNVQYLPVKLVPAAADPLNVPAKGSGITLVLPPILLLRLKLDVLLIVGPTMF